MDWEWSERILKPAFIMVFLISISILASSVYADTYPVLNQDLENGSKSIRTNMHGTVIKIMPLGDSITSSSNSYRNRLWFLLADNGIKADFVGSKSGGYKELPDKDHEGHGGWRIDQISAMVENWLQKYTPDIVLLHIGTNDISQNYYLETAPDRFGNLIDKIVLKSPQTTVIAASIIPRKTDNKATISYNNAIREVVNERQRQGKNIYFVDIYNEARINIYKDLSDKVHPNKKGSNKMAEVWFKHLKIVLSKSDQPSMGYINGTVTNGIFAVPGVEVSIAGMNNITDKNGTYSLKASAGTYTVNAARQPEYFDYARTGVILTANNTTALDIELQEKPEGSITGSVYFTS